MDEPVNRLATPLPDSVLDRYYASHQDEVDRRRAVDCADQNLTIDDLVNEPHEHPH